MHMVVNDHIMNSITYLIYEMILLHQYYKLMGDNVNDDNKNNKY